MQALLAQHIEHHPGARTFVLVVDRLDGFDPAAEPFECLETVTDPTADVLVWVRYTGN